MLYWLGDFLQPICSFNKSLQSKEFQLAKLKNEINDVIQILNTDYIDFHKPNLINPESFDDDRSIDEIMQHNLKFGGFF